MYHLKTTNIFTNGSINLTQREFCIFLEPGHEQGKGEKYHLS